MTTIEKIKADIDWRMGELAFIKSLPHRYHISNSHSSKLKTYLVPAIYAVWEGFVNNTLLAYIHEINNTGFNTESLRIETLIYITENEDILNLSVPRTNIQQKENFINTFRHILTNPVQIKPKVLTKSNVNLCVINHLLNSFGLAPISNNYESGLNKLLNFRNRIAHGEKAIDVKDEHIEEFTRLVNNLMVEIAMNVEDGLLSRSYLKQDYIHTGL